MPTEHKGTVHLQEKEKLGTVTHAYNNNAWEAEAELMYA